MITNHGARGVGFHHGAHNFKSLANLWTAINPIPKKNHRTIGMAIHARLLLIAQKLQQIL